MNQLNKKMWVMGGSNDTIALNDVWYSKNGRKWIQASKNARWSGRACFTSGDTTSYKFGTNDVWNSKGAIK